MKISFNHPKLGDVAVEGNTIEVGGFFNQMTGGKAEAQTETASATPKVYSRGKKTARPWTENELLLVARTLINHDQNDPYIAANVTKIVQGKRHGRTRSAVYNTTANMRDYLAGKENAVPRRVQKYLKRNGLTSTSTRTAMSEGLLGLVDIAAPRTA